MKDQSSLRKTIRAIIQEMHPMSGFGFESGKRLEPEMTAGSPVETALKILTIAHRSPDTFGADLSASIRASRFDPGSLLALARVATGRPAKSSIVQVERSELEALKRAIESLGMDSGSDL